MSFGDEDTPDDNYLPRAHTCYFTIDLPKYSTPEIMKKQLLIAVEFCGEVDDDGGANSSAGGFFNADRASYGESY